MVSVEGITQAPQASNAYKKLDDIIARQGSPSDEYRNVLAQAFIEYLSESGGKYFENVGELYQETKGENLIVRREDPLAVLEMLEKQQAIEVHQKAKGDPYPNAVEWKYEYGSKGLENAFLEGIAHLNGIVTVIGFKPSHITKIETSNELKQLINPGGSVTDRSHVVSIDGTIPKSDLRFIVTKIPAQFVLSKEGLEELHDAHPGRKHIFRGVLY